MVKYKSIFDVYQIFYQINFEIDIRIQQFIFVLEYYNGTRGGVCNDSEPLIRTPHECLTAIKELGYQSYNVSITSGPFPNVPPGCSIKISDSDPLHGPHFNIDQGRGNDVFTPICKGPEKKGDFK